MTEIPAPLSGCPFYVNIDGGRFYVSVHDARQVECVRAFKRPIRLAHPDRNHRRRACGHTRNLLTAGVRWEASEARCLADVIRMRAERHVTACSRPSCHGPPQHARCRWLG